MDQSGLTLFSHAQALYSICSRSIIESSKEWAAMSEDVEGLADCFESYKVHLKKQLARQEDIHSQDVSMRTLGTNMTVEHRTKAKGLGVLEKYKLIAAAVKDSDEYLPVYFDEKKHLKEPFSNSMQGHIHSEYETFCRNKYISLLPRW